MEIKRRPHQRRQHLFINILRILDSFQLKTGERDSVVPTFVSSLHRLPIVPMVPKAYKESGSPPVVPIIPVWSPRSLAHPLWSPSSLHGLLGLQGVWLTPCGPCHPCMVSLLSPRPTRSLAHPLWSLSSPHHLRGLPKPSKHLDPPCIVPLVPVSSPWSRCHPHGPQGLYMYFLMFFFSWVVFKLALCQGQVVSA